MRRWFMLILAMMLSNVGCVSGGTVRSGENVSPNKSQPIETGYAPVNGINMYYEVHGRKDGVPLVLLHGGGSTIEVTFGKTLPVFANSRRVIAVEEQGHGRTSDRDAPVRFESSADDVTALLGFLKVEKADLFGFSNGASVALQVAIRHPRVVRKLVFASSITRRDGAHPQLWEFMKQADFSNMPQPLKDAFLRVKPDVQQLKTMHDKDAERMQSFKDVPDELVRSVRVPTLIVLGDQDIVRPEHAIELTALISGARLLVFARWARGLSWRSSDDAERLTLSRANHTTHQSISRFAVIAIKQLSPNNSMQRTALRAAADAERLGIMSTPSFPH